MPKTITVEWLRSQYACEDQVETFERVFGGSAELTEVNAAKAIEAKLDLYWLADHLLTAPARAEYSRVMAPAWAEYDRVTAPAWAEYKRVTAPAWADHLLTAPAWAEYKRVTAPALAEYSRVTAPAWAEYSRVRIHAILALLVDPANHRA